MLDNFRSYFSFCFCVLLLSIILGCQPSQNISHVSQEEAVAQAYAQRQSDLWVGVEARIEKVLSDDLNPPRHQRFIVRLNNGMTLLVAHNIDLAKRVDDLKGGETIFIYGEYEYNAKGGVIHYTHHDPSNRISGGWIEYRGVRYK